MNKLPLLLSLLALGALGLVACGEDDEDNTTEAAASPQTTAEARFPSDTLSREQVQHLRRVATEWTSLFAAGAPADAGSCTPIMGQPLCVRLDCARHRGDPGDPIENCTPMSAAFQKSFADATVEDIALKGIAVDREAAPAYRAAYRAAVKFSNGVVVVFTGAPLGAKQPEWGIAPPNRRFLRAATGGAAQPAKQVTPAEYAAVNYGQSEAEVRAILGEPQLTDHIAQGPSVCWYYDVSPEQTTLRERLRYATQICFDDIPNGLVNYTRHGSK